MNRPSAESEAMVVIDRLCRRFGPVEAVRGISLQIRRGEVFGLLGPNGAGKTTTIKMILGLLAPTSGSIIVGGIDAVADPVAVRRMIGWVPQYPTLDPLLTGREQLLLHARLHGVTDAAERVEALLRRFDLTAAADRLIRGYSGGMRKRLDLAAGILHRPALLILDEPTAALDVTSRHQIWELIRNIRAAGTTVVMTTHYLDEAAGLCDRVAVIDRGELLALDAPIRLQQRYGRPALRLGWRDPAALEAAEPFCQERFGPEQVRRRGDRLEIAVSDGVAGAEALPHLITAGMPRPDSLEASGPSLDQVFACVTGRAFDPVTGTPIAAETGAAAEGKRAYAPPPPAVPETTVPPGEYRRQSLDWEPLLRGTVALWLRWWWRLRREKVELAVQILQPALWLVLFGGIFERVGDAAAWGGGSYLRFMAAGAAVMTVFNTALGGGAILLFDKESGSLERLLVAPIDPLAVVTSRLGFIGLVGALQSLVVLLIAVLLGVIPAAGFAAVPGVLLLSVLLGIGIAAGSLMLAFLVPRHGLFFTLTGLLSMPVLFLSSTFAPLESLPGWLAAISRANPLTYAVEGARSLILHGWDGRMIAHITGAVGLFAASMLVAAGRVMRRTLSP